MSVFPEEFESVDHHYRRPRIVVSLAERHVAGFARLDGSPILNHKLLEAKDVGFRSYHSRYLDDHPDFHGLTPEEKQDKYENTLRQVMSQARLFKRVPLHAIEKILKDGVFRNQFETGETRGSVQSAGGYRWGREDSLFNLHQREPEFRPTYGFVAHTPFIGLTKHYGNAIVELHHHIRPFTSFANGDTLSSSNDTVSMINAPHGTSIHPSELMEYLKLNDGNQGALDKEALWSHGRYGRELLHQIHVGHANSNTHQSSPDDLFDLRERLTHEPVLPDHAYRYMESQYHHRINPFRDIKHIYLPDNPTEMNDMEYGQLHSLLGAHSIPTKTFTRKISSLVHPHSEYSL